jgi:glycosyltransferase involved in cell wall biosynthesis
MKKKVMLVADELRTLNAGTEGQMLVLHQGLQAAGWHSELTVLRNAESVRSGWPGPVRELGITRMASPVAWWRAWRFARRLGREGYALAHVYFNDAAVILPPFLHLAGLKVVVSRRDMGFWYTTGTLRALRIVRRFVDRVVANSRAVADSVAVAEGYAPEKITVIYNGIWPTAAGDADADASPARPVIGLVANIRPVKRIEDAVAAFARIAKNHPAVVLEIVGGGDATELKAQAETLGVGDRVHFSGRVTDVRPRLQRYAFCVLTSESEGLSNAIIEYSLAGRAVICSDTGGNPEVVVHGETGLLYPMGDVDALAMQMDRLLSDPGSCERMGAAGLRRSTKLFAPTAMISAHEAMYRQLLESHSSDGAISGAKPAGQVKEHPRV